MPAMRPQMDPADAGPAEVVPKLQTNAMGHAEQVEIAITDAGVEIPTAVRTPSS